jgi:hypothetical protein
MIAGDTRVLLQTVHSHKNLVGTISKKGRHAKHERRRFYLQDLHLVDRAVCIIEHIIDGPGKLEDILAIEWGDKSLVQFIDQDAPGFISDSV